MVEGINIVDQLCVYVNGGMKRDVSQLLINNGLLIINNL